jgi:hypothetical protein
MKPGDQKPEFWGNLDPNGRIVTPGSFGRIISTSSNIASNEQWIRSV